MTITKSSPRINVKNIIFLTDFSEPSDAALPFATALANAYGATVQVLHVQTPVAVTGGTPESVFVAIETQEEISRRGLKHLEALMSATPHEVHVVRDNGVWPALKEAIAACNADLVILGTHGRTGAEKLFLGSTAEEILRKASIPVLTIGPEACAPAHGGFRHILFAIDFTPESMAGAPYAFSIAEENQSELTLLHVLPRPKKPGSGQPNQTSVAAAMHDLCELVPKDAGNWCRPNAAVEFGEPSERILQAALERNCDLIVLGVRHAALPTYFLAGGTAYQIIAHATCPVLTVRGTNTGTD